VAPCAFDLVSFSFAGREESEGNAVAYKVLNEPGTSAVITTLPVSPANAPTLASSDTP